MASAPSKVAWVNYAGLEGDASYGLHKTYCPKGGSIFTFGVKGDYEPQGDGQPA